MSQWLNKLHPASYRGVPFYPIGPLTGAVGRRRANHEYAGRDVPYSEDMGRMQRVYTIPGGIDGDDFIEESHRLLDAFEKKGAGKLVHPYFGELYITVEASYQYEGRFFSFQLTAEEAGTDKYPSGVTDTRSVVLAQAAVAKQLSIDFFSASYDISGSEFVREDTYKNIIDLLNKVGGLSIKNISPLISTAELLATSIFDAIAGVDSTSNRLERSNGVDSTSNRLDRINSVIADIDFSSPKTGVRQRIAKNTQIVRQLITQAVVIEESKRVVLIDFESQAQAQTQVNTLVAALEKVSVPVDDTLYRKLTDLRIAVQQDMQVRMPLLPRLQVVTLPQLMPALVVAYRYTDDVANEQQIIDRNVVRHPGFMRGDIEVINV